MEQTPNALRKQVVILGNANAGKSTLFNALTGQEGSIVSDAPGTTTDPVKAAMELIPFGPIVVLDTAGLDDGTPLGAQRIQKTHAAKRRADAAIYVAEAGSFDRKAYEVFRDEGLDHLLVFAKWDLAGEALRRRLLGDYPGAIPLSPTEGLPVLRERLAALLVGQGEADHDLIGGLVGAGGSVILVTPIDSEAPKGRLILPQVQVLRDCLDNGITATVCRELELEKALDNLGRVDLVVTDSQAFGYVEQRVPKNIPLTSFSMLLARSKGNFPQLLAGAEALNRLGEGDRLLMLEGCIHNHTHEDIGRVKIPAMLRKKTGKGLSFDYYSGYDFPGDLSPYAMAIQCGSCMLARGEIASRLRLMAAAGLPVTNYGMALAWGSGILERSCEIFREGERR